MALFRRQLVHLWTVLLHDQRRASSVRRRWVGWLSRGLFATPRDDVKPVTAGELTDYLRDIAVNVRYLHSEIDAIERVEILRALRKGEFDVLVGIKPSPRGPRVVGEADAAALALGQPKSALAAQTSPP